MNERMWVRVGVEVVWNEVVNGSCACEGCVDQLRVVEDEEKRALESCLYALLSS